MTDDQITLNLLVKEVDTLADMRVVITDQEKNIVFTDLEGISEDMYQNCSLVTKKASKIGKPRIPTETGKPFPFTANPTHFDIAHVQYTPDTTTQNTDNYFIFCSQQEPIQRLDSLKKAKFFAVGIRQVPSDRQRLLLVNETDKELISTHKITGSNTSNPTFPRIPDDPRDQKYI